MPQQLLHVAVIGAQTQRADPKKPFTVYRTTVNFRGQCYQRLVRYQQFRWFHKRLEARDLAALLGVAFPGKKWTRSASLQNDVVEARQVMLNEYMARVAACELTPGSADRLLRLLNVGAYGVDSASTTASLKTPVASTSCERSGGGEPSERSHEDSAVANARREDLRADGKDVAVGPSIVFRSMTSSAETVLTDDERDERLDPSATVPVPRGRYKQRTVARPQQPAKETTAPQPKKVQFNESGPAAPAAAPAAAAGDDEMADAGSPEHKYRRQIEQKMSDIQDMISSFSSLDDAPLSIRT